MNPTPPVPARLHLIGILDHPDPQDLAVEGRVAAALAAGLPSLMLRDHRRSDAELIDLARGLREQTRRSGALLLINRRLELVGEVGADGIHVGRNDSSPAALRERLGEDTIVGYSAHEPEEARDVLERGAHYVTFSPIFPTPSKAGILRPRGVESLRRLCATAKGPVLALGGIDSTNAHDVMEAGAHGIVAIRAVFGSRTDTATAVRTLLAAIDRRRGDELNRRP